MSGVDWNSHPILIAGGAFAAGLTLASTIAIPIYMTSQQNSYNEKAISQQNSFNDKIIFQQKGFDDKLKIIEDRYASDKADIENVRNLKNENDMLRREISSALLDIYQISKSTPINKSDMRPVGLQSIKKGVPLAVVLTLFPKARLKPDGTSYIELRNGLFEKMMIEADNKTISDVNYYVKDDSINKDRLKAAVTALLGPPTRQLVQKHAEPMYFWDVGSRHVVIYRDQYSVHATRYS